MVLPPRKVSLAEFEVWARKNLRLTDEVVLEATTNAWYLYDLLEPLVERVVVCHPQRHSLVPPASDVFSQVQCPWWAKLALTPSEKGQTHRTGGITKQGRKELRAVLIESAWTAVRYDQHWQEQFKQLAYRIGREKAIVAIARKLLVIIWHVLTAKGADRRAKPQQVARYFITWGRQLRVKSTLGIKASEFARQQLDHLELGQELDRVPYGSVMYCLPPTTTTT